MEDIVDILVARTENNDRAFFRVIVAYFFGKMAGSQRTTIRTKDRGQVPVNVYALSLATSGSGKGHSIGVIEDSLLPQFRQSLMTSTLHEISEKNLLKIAAERAVIKDVPEEEELEKVKKEYARLGHLAYTFDSGTTPAVKQMRQKLMMANVCAINMQIDEIGLNLVPNTELLTLFLELFDQGKVKQKLTKNTNDNERSEEMEGKTPTNMLLFGSPSKLLDGSRTEDEFYSFLETGYARRCFFAYGSLQRASETLTPAEIYANLTSQKNEAMVHSYADLFGMLGTPAKYGWEVEVPDSVGIELIEYKIECERKADAMKEHEEIMKAEMSHRYFKALKLAGAMAFVDEKSEITSETLWMAIKLAEESGEAFQKIFQREKNYAKLAKYLSAIGTELTHADLNEALPFYKSSATLRNEMMNLAIAWGYKNHIVIKKTFEQGIEFFKGEALKETNLKELKVSYSDHVAYRYRSENITWENLQKLVLMKDMHYLNHFLLEGDEGRGHRNEENCLRGFNFIVVDVDEGTPIELARELLKDYTSIIHTTKRHTDEEHRYRILLPINYNLSMDSADFKEFMKNVYDWLPFNKDEQTNQRSRKWLTHPGTIHVNEGVLLDAFQFIPRTARNEDFKNTITKLENLDNLERWFAQRMATGNRNNYMLRFAMALYDSGLTYNEIEDRVLAFNAKLDNKLPNDELKNTVLVTVAKKFTNTP